MLQPGEDLIVAKRMREVLEAAVSCSGQRRAGRHRVEFLNPYPVAAFLDQIEFVGLDVVKQLLQAAGPLDLNSFSSSRLAQTEIGAQIALRQITAAAFDLPNL